MTFSKDEMSKKMLVKNENILPVVQLKRFLAYKQTQRFVYRLVTHQWSDSKILQLPVTTKNDE